MHDIDARLRGPLMSFFVRRVRDRNEAEDLTQQVFVRLLGSSDPQGIENVEAFAFRIATNLLRDRGRASMRRPDVEVPDSDSHLPATLVEEISPERVLIDRQALNRALATLNELGPTTRNIFVLFRLEGLKQREISDRLGLSRSQVEKHVAKAILHLSLKHGMH